MKLKSWLAGLAGAVTMGIVALPAEAAAAGGLNALQGTAAQTTAVQQAHWYDDRYGHRRYHYGYGPRYYYGYRHFRHHHHHHRHHRYW